MQSILVFCAYIYLSALSSCRQSAGDDLSFGKMRGISTVCDISLSFVTPLLYYCVNFAEQVTAGATGARAR